MTVHFISEALMCKVFPSSLGLVAIRWFDGLKEGSINSFKELTWVWGPFCDLQQGSSAFGLFVVHGNVGGGDLENVL